MISFHRLQSSGKAQSYIDDVLTNGPWSGGGDAKYARKCLQFFTDTYGFKNTWLTHSCTSALETAAMLLDIQPGDEVILPSYTYVGTATAFYREGATLVFADSRNDHPNMSLTDCAAKITKRTRAIVLVHYGGVAHDMEAWVELARTHNLVLIEDAAHSIHSFYTKKPLGSFGHISAFSFHATKNISCGEGGLLVVNDERLLKRAQIIMDKGTNRNAFMRGEVSAYEWVGKGSSFVLSEILCAVLWSQLEILEQVTLDRRKVWEQLDKGLAGKGLTQPMPELSRHNGHIFYVITSKSNTLLKNLKQKDINALSHYQSLHKSPFILEKSRSKYSELVNSEVFTSNLVRIPCHGLLNSEEVKTVINNVLISI